MSSTTSGAHPAPVLSLSLLVHRREKIHGILMKYAGEELAGSSIDQLSRELNEAVRPKVKDDGALMAMTFDTRHAVRETVRTLLAGRVLTEALMASVTVRIAGNYDQLRIGAPVLHFAGQPYDQWALVKVVDAVWHLTKVKRTPGSMVTFKVLSSLAAGESFTQFLPEFFMDRMARDIGAKAPGLFRTIHYRELVGMFAGVLLGAGEVLLVKEYKALDALHTRNAALTKKRGDGRVCPHDYKWPCTYCHVGHVSCPLGTHAVNYVKRTCGNLPSHEGWFDPHDIDARFCLSCQARRRKNAR